MTQNVEILPVIEKAIKTYENSGQSVDDHFVVVHEMASLGSGAKRRIESFALPKLKTNWVLLSSKNTDIQNCMAA